MNLKIIHKNFTEIIEINPEINPETSMEIYYASPFESNAERWKQEIYFKIPIKIKIKKENQNANIKKGDVAYFPLMKVLCIFYGNTQPIAPVNIIGEIKNPEKFMEVKQGDLIKIERV